MSKASIRRKPVLASERSERQGKTWQDRFKSYTGPSEIKLVQKPKAFPYSILLLVLLWISYYVLVMPTKSAGISVCEGDFFMLNSYYLVYLCNAHNAHENSTLKMSTTWYHLALTEWHTSSKKTIDEPLFIPIQLVTLTGCLSLGPSLSQVPEHGSWTSCCSAFSAFPIAINHGQRHIHLWASLVLSRLYNATIARNIFCVSLSFPSSLHRVVLLNLRSMRTMRNTQLLHHRPSRWPRMSLTRRVRFRPSLPPWTGTNAVVRVR